MSLSLPCTVQVGVELARSRVEDTPPWQRSSCPLRRPCPVGGAAKSKTSRLSRIAALHRSHGRADEDLGESAGRGRRRPAGGGSRRGCRSNTRSSVTRSGNGFVSENQAAIAASYEATCEKASAARSRRVSSESSPRDVLISSSRNPYRSGSVTARPSRSSSPLPAPSSGRRCRCWRSPRAPARLGASRPSGTDTGCRSRGRSARCRPRPASACRRRGRGGRGSRRGVLPRMKRLHPAAEELGRAGQLLDRRHLDARIAQERRRAGRGDDLDAELGEA